MNDLQTDALNVKLPGGRVYVNRWTPDADSGKPPIILLHESLGCVGLWRAFPAELAEATGRSVIAYDRLGFGRSDARNSMPSRQFIEEEATRYFPALKEQLSLSRYALLGHSVGGGMAIHIAARDPDCQAVVTLSAQAFVEDRTLTGIRDAEQMFAQPGQMARLEKWHGEKASWVLRAWTDVWLSDAFRDWSLLPEIGRVRCPVLAIHGDRDEYGSAAFPDFIARHAAGPADRLLLEDCGHMPHKEQPAAVIYAIRDFLDNLP
ncbi:MAG: alpha/beta hydrolase [Marinobacter sp.]|nr:alpha/beta hydrolase [Marinobacter sp.]